jgi:hypothetical protein
MEGSNTSKIKRLIGLALEANGESRSDAEISRVVQAEEPELFTAWALERLAETVRTARHFRRQTSPYQALLFGFTRLSERVPFRGGRVILSKMTLMDLRSSLKLDRDKASAKAQRKINLIAAMAPYATVQRGITVGRYCELVAAGIPPKLAKGPREAQNPEVG